MVPESPVMTRHHARTELILQEQRIRRNERRMRGRYVRPRSDGVIREVSKPINAASANVIDVGGRTLMPG